MAVFVFGSNLAGRHGKGAALTAVKEYGAVYGRGIGRQGNAYAIPTKDAKLKVLPLSDIEDHVRDFIAYAIEHLDEVFTVTRIGCGLAGYRDADIAPMFRTAPPNCHLPDGWRAPPRTLTPKVEREMLARHGTQLCTLPPEAIVTAARADLAARLANIRDFEAFQADRRCLVQVRQYAFHRSHVGRSGTARELIELALADRERGAASAKHNTRMIYGDEALLRRALELVGG